MQQTEKDLPKVKDIIESMRKLPDIIDSIVEVAPELEEHFVSVKESARFAAPELMYIHWNRAAEILTEHVNDHPERDKIAAIFSGCEDG